MNTRETSSIVRGPETPEQQLGRWQRHLDDLEAKLNKYKSAEEDSEGHIEVDLKTDHKFTKEEAITDVEGAIEKVKKTIDELKPQGRVIV